MIINGRLSAAAVLIGALAAGGSFLTPALQAQVTFEMRPAEPIQLPFVVDSNTPAFWRDGNLYLFSSAGKPLISTFDAQRQQYRTEPVVLDRNDHLPMWIESVWQEPAGALYAWYHHERIGVCPKLNLPEIGALVSRDGGRSFTDLGIILSSGEWTDCSARNGYFANGHGDFSVIADRDREYFYFLFGAYGGDVSNQGIAIARMPLGNVSNPVGNVWKYHQGAWSEPGIGGPVTPVFPAAVSWREADTDSFWGPSIHWNAHVRRYVVLMNRSCCGSGWPQEGVYMTMNANLSDPAAWTQPKKIVAFGDWYPWVLGMGEGETSSEAGQRVRLFIRQTSEWEIVFRSEEEPPPPSVEPPPPSEPSLPVDPPSPPSGSPPVNPPPPGKALTAPYK